jgi:DNA-binding MarR family transcriptional regulator
MTSHTPALVPPLTKRSALERRAAEMAMMFIDIDDLLTKKRDSAALTPQARLLLGLLIHRSMTVKEALMYTPRSYRTFYVMITKLKAHGLIQIDGVENDRRVRRLTLGRRFMPVIKQLAAHREALMEKF